MNRKLICQILNHEMMLATSKGQWIAGSSISYSEHTEDNYQFLIIDGFKSDGYYPFAIE